MNNYLSKYLIIITLLMMGCKKKDECTAGQGGNLTIVAKTLHHTKPIPGCTLYIKYCTQEYPGDNNYTAYDKSYKIANDTFQIAVNGLQNGEYYLYALGVDSALDPSNNIVKGGIPFSTDQKDGTVYLTVPVTEGD